jgi:unsaturated rhamnogalacturonyl hydrolase
LKNNAVRGGTLENIFMRNIKIGTVLEAVLTVDFLYEEGAKGKFPAVARNIQLDNITSSGSPRVLWIRGFEGAVIDGIRISNSTFKGVTATDVVSNAGTITLSNVTVEPATAVKSLSTRPSSN